MIGWILFPVGSYGEREKPRASGTRWNEDTRYTGNERVRGAITRPRGGADSKFTATSVTIGRGNNYSPDGGDTYDLG